MKKLIISTIAAFALTTTGALAFGDNYGGTGGNANQAQNQNQGQNQAQGQAQGQGQAQSSSNNNSVTNVNEAGAYAPGFGVSDCSFSVSAGWVGGGAGFGIPSKRCNVYTETGMLYELTGDRNIALRHLQLHNNRVRATLKDSTAPAAVTTSLRPQSRPAKPRYCSTNDLGQTVVKVPAGASEALRAERVAACIQ